MTFLLYPPDDNFGLIFLLICGAIAFIISVSTHKEEKK